MWTGRRTSRTWRTMLVERGRVHCWATSHRWAVRCVRSGLRVDCVWRVALTSREPLWSAAVEYTEHSDLTCSLLTYLLLAFYHHYVMRSICVSFSLSVCRITADIISWIHWNLVLWLDLSVERTDWRLVVIRSQIRITVPHPSSLRSRGFDEIF